MTILFPTLVVVAALLSLPAYLYSRKRARESLWLVFTSVPAVVVWVALTAAGVGAQSLSNLVEVLVLVAASVLLAYLKVFILDRRIAAAPGSTYGLMMILTLAAILSRLFMPVIPE